MTRALKRTALAVLGLIVLQLAVLGTAAAQQIEPPALPNQFYGTVTVNGVAAPDGTRVSAEVNGVEAKASSTREGKYGYDTGDLFRVDGSCVSSSHRSNSVGPKRSRGSISRTTR